ncbi:MAG TPA: metallopeptidase TldD-related protein [Thermoanaerobaculia bacterium]|nr:metallopeptidase TldD-related protein [Thermoanaerobaculia bacterium]
MTPTATAAPLLQEVLVSLLRRGMPEVEVFAKRGRSRRLEITPLTETSLFSQEQGWAVRAGDPRRSFFAAGTGEPVTDWLWPEPTGRPIRLPEPTPAGLLAAAWNEPSDFDAPLVGEREGLKLLESLGRELAAELPGARLLRAALEDGSSESEILNSRGLSVRSRARVATLYLEAAGPGRPASSASVYLSAREARRFHPTALARRLADRLAVTAQGGPPDRDRGELLLAPPVVARLLCGLLPLLVGPRAGGLLAGLRDRRGRIGSEWLTLIDNGRLPGGVLESAADGEGVPTREVVLVEEGVFRQPLLTWLQAESHSGAGSASGCTARPGWRDLPVPGPTHLYLKPDPKVPVAALLGSIAHGYYLIDVTSGARFDLGGGTFALPVCGFAVEGGRASAPVARAWLCGGIGDLLQGIAGVGRDLSFHPLAGLIGAPTVLATGLELRGG